MVRSRFVVPGPDLRLETLLSTYQVGGLLQVDPVTVGRWMQRNNQPFSRTQGGHRRITVATVLALAKAHDVAVPAVLRHLVRPSIVFVDDEPRELKSVTRLLQPHAARVAFHAADNAIDGLLKIGEVQPTLVILDVVMPGLNGIEACRRIRATPSLKATRVLMVSANMTEAIERDALAAGADRCLNKPLAVRDILALLGVATRAEDL
ncbi:MAG: response regulator [Deltaproteobacteria bacterium]|nr:response regulator [Deltaproteobacteria bacterium]